MPSPDALSPSGLKSGSQFYPSYPNNPRRRPPDGGLGKKNKNKLATDNKMLNYFFILEIKILIGLYYILKRSAVHINLVLKA